MSRVIEFLPEAEREAEAAYRWYERQKTGLGLDFLLSLDAAINRLSRLPERHEIVALRTRKVLLRRFPYLLLYVPEEKRILITAVYHAHRDPHFWSDRVRERVVDSTTSHAMDVFASSQSSAAGALRRS